MLILGAILIALGALLAVVALFMTVTRSESGVEHLGSGQALFLAESGREQALRSLIVDKTFCSAAGMSFNGVSLGAGSFTAGGISYRIQTQLTSAIGAADTVIPVASTTSFADHGRVLIDLEEINYAGLGTVASDCTPVSAPCLTGVQRGAAGTGAVAHAVNLSVGQEQCLITASATATRTGSRRTVNNTRRVVPAMMVYTKYYGNTVPYFRLWNGSAWGPERAAIPVAGSISFLTVKMARTRNEAILAIQDSGGNVTAQRWDGTAWVEQQSIDTIPAAADRNMFGVDVAYETARDRAVIVKNAASGGGEEYTTTIWDGTRWISAGTNSLTANVGRPRWVRLAANPLPTSNDIAMQVLTSNSDVYGMLWTGAGWSSMSVTNGWGNQADTNIRQAIAVAYESQSGHALFVWGTDQNDEAQWRTWNGSSLSAINTLTFSINGELIHWAQLAPDPYSDHMLLGIQSHTGNPYVSTAHWSGSGFSSTSTITVSTETNVSRSFDLAFETAPNASHRARIAYGTTAVVNVREGYLSTIGTWTWGAAGGLTGDEDTVYFRMVAHPRTGTMLAALYENRIGTTNGGKIRESHITDGVGGNTAWTAVNTSWPWSGPAVRNTRGFLVDIAVSPYMPHVDWMEIYQ